ncbi:MAG: hypothetical protein AAFQ82_20920 [Myxococcota bacterium]
MTLWVLLAVLSAQADEDTARKKRLDELLGPVPQNADSGDLLDERPDPLRLREPWLAAGLGGAVGFGSGHFYAGNPTRGTVMGGIDTVLGLSALWVFARLRSEQAQNDLVFGSAERPRTDREDDLRSGLVALTTGLLLSRAYQSVVSYLDAEKTNQRLEGFSFVPLPPRNASEP